jgi:hypothetical protein
LQSFLGFATYYRKFIYAFGEIASPLFKIPRDGVEFKWSEKERDAINMLKDKILKEVVLYFSDFEAAKKDIARQFVIMTDASKIGISAVLCQPDLYGKIRPIYFASRQCNKHESRYCPTELEALAVRFGVKKFSQFITMIPCRFLADHKALVSMFRSKNETARVDEETKNSEFAEMYTFLVNRILPPEMNKRHQLLEKCHKFTVIEQLLYWNDKKSGEMKLFVQFKFWQKLVNNRHSGVCAGHQSGIKLFRQLSESYFCPNLRAV